MEIRFVNLDDAAGIAAIYNRYITETTVTFEVESLDTATMQARISSLMKHGAYVVAEEKGSVVGYAYAHPWKERTAFRHTWETTVYVSPEFQGQGIGLRLMEELIAQCRERGVHALVACITAENEGSRRMHTRLGFCQVSLYKEVGYKFGRWLDVTDYELML